MGIRSKIGAVLEVLHVRKYARPIEYCFRPSGLLRNEILFPIGGLLRKMGLASSEDLEIKRMKNIHRGKRIFIIATGPSLTLDDVNMLKDEYTMGLNSFFRMYEKIDWRPTYYALLDENGMSRYKKNGVIPEVQNLAKDKCFMNSTSKSLTRSAKTIFVHLSKLDHFINYGSLRFKYSPDALFGMYDFYTITNTAIQLAMYMGFQDIYIIGVDNNFIGPKEHFEETRGDAKHTIESGLHTQMVMDAGYKEMRRIADKAGVNVYNATRGGRVEAFPRVKLEDLF